MGWSRATQRRWETVCGWLLRSRRAAAWARKSAVFDDPSTSDVFLPQYDRSPERARGLERARRAYQLVPIAEKLDLPVAWNHQTLVELPKELQYTRRLKLPKLLLVIALTRELMPPGHDERWDSLEQIDEAYDKLGLPPIRDLWRDDLQFARLRVQGPNPVWLQGGWSRQRLRAAGLTEESAALAGLPDEGDPAWDRWYAVGYHGPLQGATPTPGRYLYPCFALFEEVDDVLHPRGIQLELEPGEAVWRAPDGSPAWQLAKVFFGSADIFVHEVISHWMWTHVIAEKLAIATARTLSERHPLRRLFWPHLTSTVAMNLNATNVLVGLGGTFDTTFAGADVKARLVEYGDAAWRYHHMVHPRRIEALKVDGLAHHPFAEDGQAVWDVVHEHVQEYVGFVYADEQDLFDDTELKDWSELLGGWLGQQGFPAVDSREVLVEVATAVLFNPIHHALVNSLQFEIFGYPPMHPPTVPVPMPRRADEVDEAMLIEALPSVRVTLDTIRSTFGFSAQYDRYGDHLDPWYIGSTTALLARFRRALADVSERINRRNSERGFACRVARPDLIGNSIDA